MSSAKLGAVRGQTETGSRGAWGEGLGRGCKG